ncbi:hypothetical protein M422DRAFT_780437 [Sphaerobolus stellatus SS14]|uniref:Cupredoxin n=1 Tax=Sphaerobolus stellatus (strain SS14) TaxID=990650 RepID=A0A0C9ULP9_SPHS4|nr:hypothetical protein M422DRAFT_232874 [Sphaerobolus stellatus SS14]KIJ41303.1 hypothetical protein M422DRAFT_780437 [Sphaerobolus stellatus SS14]
MHFSLVATLLAFAASSAAQTTHTVTVGANGTLAFSPSNITVAMGDKVAFQFMAKNHTATQSTFADPCVPASINGSAGVDSGFMAIPANNSLQAGQFPTWTITVNTQSPIWFHCAQTIPKNHCQAGMVFSINATPEKSFDAYLATAESFDPSTLAAAAGNSTAADPAAAPSNGTDASGSISTAPSNGTDAGSSASLTPSNGTDAGSSASLTLSNGTDTSSTDLTPAAASTAAASAGTGANNAGSAEASTQSVGVNGAASVVVSRGAAGLLAAFVISAVLI